MASLGKLLFGGGAIGILIWAALVVGYIANIVKIVHHISEPLSALEVFRMIGILVAPLGAVLGFC